VAGDTQRVEVRAVDAATGEARTYAVFRAVGRAAAPASLAPVADYLRGGPANQLLLDSLAVRVRDAHGNLAPGARVAWAVRTGGGSVASAESVSDAAGVARMAWTLGPADEQTVEASIAGAAPVSFTATTQVYVGIEGDGQVGEVGKPVMISARVSDAQGRLVGGFPIRWTVRAGGGSVSPAEVKSNAEGLASTTWTLGAEQPDQRVQVVVNGAPVLEAHALAGPFVVEATGGGQTGPVASRLPDSLRVRVMWNGQPRAGVGLVWVSSHGTVTGSGVTDAQGEARAAWTLGTVVGPQVVNAYLTLSAATTWTSSFPATAVPGPAARVTTVSGGGTSFCPVFAYDPYATNSNSAGTVAVYPPTVRVTDAFGNPVAGATVQWQPSALASVSPATSTTGASGQATTSWTLSTRMGGDSVAASVAGVGSAKVYAYVCWGPARRVAASLETAAVAAGKDQSVTLLLTDIYGNYPTLTSNNYHTRFTTGSQDPAVAVGLVPGPTSFTYYGSVRGVGPGTTKVWFGTTVPGVIPDTVVVTVTSSAAARTPAP
jgi:hypothetical protein